MNNKNNNNITDNYNTIRKVILGAIGGLVISTNVSLAQNVPTQNSNNSKPKTVSENYLSYPFQHVLSEKNCFVNSSIANKTDVKYEVIPINPSIPKTASYNELTVKGSISELIEQSLNNTDKIIINGKETYYKGVLTSNEIQTINTALMLRKYNNMAVLVNANDSPTVLLFGDIDCYEAQKQSIKPSIVQKSKVKPNTKSVEKIIPLPPKKHESNPDSLLNVINKKVNGLDNKLTNLKSDTSCCVKNSYNNNNNVNIIIINNVAAKDTIKIPVKSIDTISVLSKKALYIELGPEMLTEYNKDMEKLVPQLGIGFYKNNWSFGLTAGYKQFNTENNKIFLNGLGNGSTELHHKTNTNFLEYGFKTNFNTSKKIYFGLGLQQHIRKDNITGWSNQIVYDDAGNMRSKICTLPNEQTTKKYLTLNPEIGANLSKDWSIYGSTKFTTKKLYSVDAGLRYTIHKNSTKRNK